MSGKYNNSLDNSEVPIKEDEHNTMIGFESESQARQYKLYLENLKLMAELAASGDALEVGIGKNSAGKELFQTLLIKDLVPKESEFDRLRKTIISKLNQMTDSDLRQWMSRFGTDNIFVLSGRISAYQLDKRKRDEAFTKFNVWVEGDGAGLAHEKAAPKG